MNSSHEVFCFDPDLQEFQSLIGAFGSVFLLAVSSLIYSFKYKPIRASYKQLWQLISAFLVFIPAGIIVFSGWMYVKLKPICIQETNISIGNEIFEPSEITRIYIHKEQLGDNLVQVGKADFFRMLVIDLPDKQYIFSDQHYPIDKIYDKLKNHFNIE